MLKNNCFLILIFIVFFINGCNRINNKQDIKDKNITKLAKVNNHIITTKILGKKANRFNNLNSNLKKIIVDKLIDDEILIQYALDKNSSYSIENENKRAKWGLLSLSKLFLELNNHKLNDDNLKLIYEKNKKKYWHDEFVKVSHILVKTEKEANKIIFDLNNSSDINKIFIDICKNKSLDKRTSGNGGYLGIFNPQIMPIPLKEAVNKLSIHSYTHKAIKTKYGYDILYLHDKRQKGYFSFEEVKKQIMLQENKKRMDKWASFLLKKLRKDANVSYLYDIKNSK